MRREHARERQEARDKEWDIRDGEDYAIQMMRDAMAQTLADKELSAEERKEKLAGLKAKIDEILDKRDEREHLFIERELRHHEAEQKLQQEIDEEARKNAPEPPQNSLNLLFRARSSLTAGAEKLRKDIQENSRELDEDEQFSTILINNSEMDGVPDFKKSRKRREAEPPEQTARIDTIVIKQREIGMMYRDSQEQQNRILGKSTTKTETKSE